MRACSSKIKESRHMHVVSHVHSSQERQSYIAKMVPR